MKKRKEVVENEEIKSLKKKYKKLKYSIIIPIVVIVFVILIKFTYNVYVIQNLLRNSVAVDFGDNYKTTTISYQNSKPEEQNKTVIYHKDGIVSTKLQNGKFGIVKTPEISYQLMYETKEYRKMEGGLIIGDTNTASLLNFFMIAENEVEDTMKVAQFIYQARIDVGIEKIDGIKYYVLKFIGFEEVFYVNSETYLVDKYSSNDNTFEIKIEKDVVTDEDIKLPQDMGFTEITG